VKIVLGFEHVRRLKGARSHLVVELAHRLIGRGHEVVVVCDTVTDPSLFPDVDFIARRAFQSGESHRLFLLYRWSKSLLETLEYDVSLSFFPAICGDLLIPSFSWIQTKRRRECRSWWRSMVSLAHPSVFEQYGVESLARRNPRLQGLVALSEAMAEGLEEVRLPAGLDVQVLPGASPIEPPPVDQWETIRCETRKTLGLDQGAVVFLCGSIHLTWRNRRMVVDCFGEILKRLDYDQSVNLVVAGENQWAIHRRSVECGCDEQVRIVGRTSEMDRLLVACDVGIVPAVHSCLGRSLLEFPAFGKPVIATDITAGLERLRVDESMNGDGDMAGLVVPARDRESMCEAMMTMLDTEERARMTRSAELIAPSLCFDGFVDRIERLLAEVVGGME